jgi:hypothetical protein
MFKVFGHMGDGLENLVLGLISSILPNNNSIANKISKTSKVITFFKLPSNLVTQSFQSTKYLKFLHVARAVAHSLGL